MRPVTGVVLAGGNSRRMGRNKALLPYGHETLVEHIVNRLHPYCQEVLVSVKDREPFEFLNIPLISDTRTDCGPLAGIESALAASKNPWCFIVPCDLANFSGAIVPLLISEIGEADLCVPILQDFYEPLVALYATKALPKVVRALDEGRYKVTDVFTDLLVKEISENHLRQRKLEHIFQNINTFTEYEKLQVYLHAEENSKKRQTKSKK